MEDVVVTQVPGVTPRPVRGRLLGVGLLAGAVAAVVALDTLPLPFSTPVTTPVAAASPSPAVSAAVVDPAAVARGAAVDATLSALTTDTRQGGSSGAEVLVPGDAALKRAVTRFVGNARAVTGTTSVTRDTHGPLDAQPDGTVSTTLSVTTLLPGANPTSTTVDAVFTAAGDRWLLSGWTPRSGATGVPESPLLLPADLVGVRTAHTLLVGSRSAGRLNTRLSRRLEAAVGQVRPILGDQGWDGSVVAYAVLEPSVVKTLLGADERHRRPDLDLRWWDASFTGEARLTLAPGYVLRDDAVTRQALRGAVADRAAMASSDSSLPKWMRDAVVAYAETRTGVVVDGAAAVDARGLFDDTWSGFRRRTWRPALRIEAADAVVASDHEVDSAFFAWHYVVDTKGEGVARSLWRAAARGPGTPAEREKAALKSVLRTTPSAFRVAVRGYAARIVAAAA